MLRPMTIVRLRLRSLLLRRREEAELDRELRFHLDALADEQLAAGRPAEDAARLARRAFGGTDQIKEACRDARGVRAIDELWRDVRHALRALARSRTYACTCVLTLALGIGVNAAVTSLVAAVIVRPLPYAAPHDLLSLWEEVGAKLPDSITSHGAAAGRPGERVRLSVAPANLADYRRDVAGRAELAAYSFEGANVAGSGPPERLWGERVTWNLLPLLGVRPQLGRGFTAADDRPDAARVALITDGLWRRRFGADPDILGRPLRLDGRVHVIVGVLPPDFRSPGQLVFREPV
jgi:hypothetical protein